MYIDRDITISETDSAIARIIDEDGNVIMTEGLVLQDEKIWCEFVNKDIVHKRCV